MNPGIGTPSQETASDAYRRLTFHTAPSKRGAGHDEVVEATAIFSGVCGIVGHSDWAAPTPCPAWSVAQLLNHVVATSTKFSDFAEGQTDAPRTPSGDLLLPDPVTAFAAARRPRRGELDQRGPES